MFENDPKGVVPNSCNGCHTEWSKDKAEYEASVKAYESLSGCNVSKKAAGKLKIGRSMILVFAFFLCWPETSSS